MIFNPNEDGINHINCHTKASTDLGRYLSNFYECNFLHPLSNVRWLTVEGYWQFLLINYVCKENGFPINEQRYINLLSKCNGYTAKLIGNKFKEKSSEYCDFDFHKERLYDSKSFRKDISFAIDLKIYSSCISPNLIHLMKQNELPYCHYYSYLDYPANSIFDWLFIDMMNEKAKRLKSGGRNE